MSPPRFAALLATYVLLIGATGAFAAFMALGSNAPSPPMLQQVSQLDKQTQEQLWGALARAEEKQKRLSEIATNGFQVTLGALIGFLSAVGAGAGGNRREGGKTPGDLKEAEAPATSPTGRETAA